MSIYGTMRTGVSGMAAQANRIAVVADNMANVNTVGYKGSSTQFSSFILDSRTGSYNSGGVTTTIRQSISQQGALQYTTSATDLAVNGNGFFVVTDPGGTPFLTRAGSFVPNGNGDLINAAGFQLMGYPLADGNPNVVVNALQGLEPINITQVALEATPSTLGTFAANLPSNAAIVPAGTLPSDNVPGSVFEAKSSLVAYDNLGNSVLVDVYFTKTANNEWEATVFNQADATPGTGFPYANPPLTSITLEFNPLNGKLAAGSPDALTLAIPGGQPLDLNLANMTQVAADYTVMQAAVNGNEPSAVRGIEFGSDGTLYTVFENGDRRSSYKIPLATVPSPDNLKATAGNVFSIGLDSGDIRLGFPGEAGFGTVVAGALEQSNVDLASELTNMIEAQRGYQANSKVFQTGSDILEILVNLKR
jgi:flagellar hook protein FlgE